MELLLPLLLGCLACIFGGLYILRVFRQRRPGEPPLDNGWIPWLGHALEFRRDPFKFLQRMTEKHGDIFTIQMGGRHITFFQDPLSFDAIFKEGQDNLSFRVVGKEVTEKTFAFLYLDNISSLDLSSHKHLQGDKLQVLTESVLTNLQNAMLHKISSAAEQEDWTEDGLFRFCSSILFKAGFLTLFGNATSGEEDKAKDMAESEDLFHEFCKYDKLYPDLVYGALSSKMQREVQRLYSFFWNALSLDKMRNKDNISSWILDIWHKRISEGFEESMIDRFMFIMLWASQSNTVAPGFWLLFYLLKHPDAMKAVRNEVHKVMMESGQGVPAGGPLVNITRDMLTKTPVLDSALEETLRLVAAPFLSRAVCQDLTLKMADDREFSVRKGDKILLFPYMTVQMNPEIHPDPLTFKYDRFLTPEGTRKTHFYKGGKSIKYYSLPWGSGVTMCPGRFFATTEIKQFVFLMLVYFNFELMNPEEKVPRFEVRRFGLGTLRPERDVHFRYRPR